MRTIAFWLSLALIFVIAWEDMVLFQDLGTVSRAIGFLVAGFWVLTVAVTGKFRKPHRFHVLVLLFVLWNMASAFWSVNVKDTTTSIQTFLQLAAMVYILWDLYTTPAALEAALQAYILGAYVAIGSTISNYLALREATYLRYAATGFDPNDVGLVMALGIPVAWHLAVTVGTGEKPRWLRLANYAYTPAAILAIILTASRGTLLATVPALVFVVGSLTRLSPFRRVLVLAVLIAALFLLQPLVPQSSLQRLASSGSSIAAADLGGRWNLWREAIAVFTEHPLFGVGGGAYRTAVESGQVAHNTFLSVLAQVGIIGFILFASILATAVYQAVRLPRWDSRLWLAVLMVWAVGAFALSHQHRKTTWLFLSLIVASANLPALHDQPIRQPRPGLMERESECPS
jgi:O-antigen ligase